MHGLRRWSGMPVAAVLVAVLVAGCGGHHAASSGPPVRVDGPDVDGLSATAGDGGQSIYAPPSRPHRWEGTVGGFVLCVRGQEGPARILDVRPRVAHGRRPVAVTFWLRTVTRAAVAAAPRRHRTAFGPIGSSLGAPPRWDQPYRDYASPGRYSRGIRGLEVGRSCTATKAATSAIDYRRVPPSGFRELLVALTVDSRGGQIRGFDITYEQRGQRWVLRTDWAITACGTSIRDRSICPAAQTRGGSGAGTQTPIGSSMEHARG